VKDLETGMIRLLAISLMIAALSGCAAFSEKGERYRDAAQMAANPEKIEIQYEREGGSSSFRECRCTGSLCE